MRYRRIKGRAGRVNAHEIQGWAKWLLENECGCCHKVVAYTEKSNICVCVGWHDNGEGYVVTARVGFQAKNSAMQTDLDIDFLIPWNTKAHCDHMNAKLTEAERRRGDRYVVGDVYDTSFHLCPEGGPAPDLHRCRLAAVYLNSSIALAARLTCECELEITSRS